MLQGGGNTQGIGRVFRNALAANASVAVLLTAVMYTVYCFVDKLGQPEELLASHTSVFCFATDFFIVYHAV